MAVHVPKKHRPNAKKLRFYSDPTEEKQAEVTDIRRKRESKQIRELLKKRNRQVG